MCQPCSFLTICNETGERHDTVQTLSIVANLSLFLQVFCPHQPISVHPEKQVAVLIVRWRELVRCLVNALSRSNSRLC